LDQILIQLATHYLNKKDNVPRIIGKAPQYRTFDAKAPGLGEKNLSTIESMKRTGSEGDFYADDPMNKFRTKKDYLQDKKSIEADKAFNQNIVEEGEATTPFEKLLTKQENENRLMREANIQEKGFSINKENAKFGSSLRKNFFPGVSKQFEINGGKIDPAISSKIEKLAEDINKIHDNDYKTWMQMYGSKGMPDKSDLSYDDLIDLMNQSGAAPKGTIGRTIEGLKGNSGAVGAYHGSPFEFEKFGPLSKVSRKGEGHQSFGHGLYFTNEKDVAQHYANVLSNKKYNSFDENMYLNGNKVTDASVRYAGGMLQSEMRLGKPQWKAAESAIDKIDKFKASIDNSGANAESVKRALEELGDYKKKVEFRNAKGTVYDVTLHPTKEQNYILWDRKLNENQVKKIAESSLVDIETASKMNGEQFYRHLSDKLGSDKLASKALLKIGIDGIDYPAGSISKSMSGARNYVVFNPRDVVVNSRQTGSAAIPTMLGAGGLAGAGLGIGLMNRNRKK
jgi:hypothetical protein